MGKSNNIVNIFGANIGIYLNVNNEIIMIQIFNIRIFVFIPDHLSPAITCHHLITCHPGKAIFPEVGVELGDRSKQYSRFIVYSLGVLCPNKGK